MEGWSGYMGADAEPLRPGYMRSDAGGARALLGSGPACAATRGLGRMPAISPLVATLRSMRAGCQLGITLTTHLDAHAGLTPNDPFV